MSMNVVAMVGRLTDDPEIRYAATCTAICTFRIAVDRLFRIEGQPKVDYFGVVCFKRQAEWVSMHLDKGSRVSIYGRLQSRKWQTAEGSERETVEIVADQVQAEETLDEAERRRGKKKVEPIRSLEDAEKPKRAARPEPIGDDEDPFGDQ